MAPFLVVVMVGGVGRSESLPCVCGGCGGGGGCEPLRIISYSWTLTPAGFLLMCVLKTACDPGCSTKTRSTPLLLVSGSSATAKEEASKAFISVLAVFRFSDVGSIEVSNFFTSVLLTGTPTMVKHCCNIFGVTSPCVPANPRNKVVNRCW